jgi:hypothetical protein
MLPYFFFFKYYVKFFFFKFFKINIRFGNFDEFLTSINITSILDGLCRLGEGSAGPK